MASAPFWSGRFSCANNSIWRVPPHCGGKRLKNVSALAGKDMNRRYIRIAKNNEKISELQFELQIMDLVTQA